MYIVLELDTKIKVFNHFNFFFYIFLVAKVIGKNLNICTSYNDNFEIFFLVRLKEQCENELSKLITLRNVAEMLDFTFMYMVIIIICFKLPIYIIFY